MTNRNDFFSACPSCGCNAYGLFPYWILNANKQEMRVHLFHCVNCGYEPEVKEANLVDPSQRDKRTDKLE